MAYDFTLTHNQRTFPKNNVPHTHNSYEFMFCVSNGGTFFIGEKSYPMCRGMLLLSLQNVPHYGVVNGEVFDCYVLRVSTDAICELSSLQTDFKAVIDSASSCLILNEEQTDSLVGMMDSCLALHNDFGEDIRREIFFLQILLYISTIIRDSNGGQLLPDIAENKRIQTVMEYIHQHYADEITLDQLSERFFINKYYLSHVFKEATGMSLKSYIINYRVQKACILLAGGESVQQTGEMTGFSNSAHFIKTFGRIMGVSPGRYAQKKSLK